MMHFLFHGHVERDGFAPGSYSTLSGVPHISTAV